MIIVKNNCEILQRKVYCLSGSALRCQNEKEGARTGTSAPLIEVARTLLCYIFLFSGYQHRKFSSSYNSLRGMIRPSVRPPRHNLYKQAETQCVFNTYIKATPDAKLHLHWLFGAFLACNSPKCQFLPKWIIFTPLGALLQRVLHLGQSPYSHVFHD